MTNENTHSSANRRFPLFSQEAVQTLIDGFTADDEMTSQRAFMDESELLRQTPRGLITSADQRKKSAIFRLIENQINKPRNRGRANAPPLIRLGQMI